MSDFDQDDEIIEDFKIEAGELLQQLDQDLIKLEETPDDLELLNQIFRAAHTIKGNASFLGFSRLTEFTHKMENVLDKLRSGDMQVSRPIMDVILESVDTMKALMDNLMDESVVDFADTVVRLQACLTGASPVVDTVLEMTPEPVAEEAIEPTDITTAGGEPVAEADDMEEIIEDFKVEAGELLEQLDQDLIKLEETPGDLELLNQIFRAAHTVKGNASFLGFAKLTEFTHQMENVLDKLRSGDMQVSQPVIDVILESVDIMKALMAHLRTPSAVDIQPTMARLRICLTEGGFAPPAPVRVAHPLVEDEPETRHDTMASTDSDETDEHEEETAQPADHDAPIVIDEDMEEIVQDFEVEAGEMLEQLGQDLVKLEETPEDLELLNQIFRAAHTVKGNASFLGFAKLTEFTHQMENVLDKLRSNQMKVTPPVMDLILESVDIMRALMAKLRTPGEVDTKQTIIKLKRCLAGELESAPKPKAPAPKPEVKAEPPPPKKTEPTTAKAPAESKKAAAAPVKRKDPEEQTIRVDVERLDALMNLAGELVIAKNRLQQFSTLFEEKFADKAPTLSESLMITANLINYVTAQFQEAVMKTRMLPIKKVFSRVPRMVRDLARDTKKEVDLQIEGEDTELDKSVIEHIGDPLVHIIRNAIDHGLELPDNREKIGKPRKGTIILRAFAEGNYIVIEIRDDGKGMDPNMIRRKAIEKGLVSSEDAAKLGERECLDFIFAPGFSTAEKISDISGRGVGMNVVKENIMKLDGTVEIYSTVGQGSIFKIQLPLTMAIVPALLVRVQQAVYAIPLANVMETLVVEQNDIYSIDGKEMIHLRDRVVSLVHLRNVLQMPPPERLPRYYVIIVGVAEQRLGLIVDQLLGQEEVVIKALGEYFANVSIIAGATIMGDGGVVLILDIGAVLQFIARNKHVAHMHGPPAAVSA